MTNLTGIFGVTLIVLLTFLWIEPAKAELRTFTDDQGRQIQAELVGMSGDNIVIKRNGKLAKWPANKLSKSDQLYVKTWNRSASKGTPKILPRIWERDGIGEKGVLNAERLDNTLGKNIPLLKQTEEKGYYKHYDVDLHNNSPVDADDLVVSYVLYVVNVKNQVVWESGSESISDIPANSRKTIATKGITYVRAKTTSTTFGTNILGNLQVGSNTSRQTEKFGGAWVRVYSPNGTMVGESKRLSDQLEALDPQWTGPTGENAIPLPKSFSQLEELFGPLKEIIKQLPKPPVDLPKPPGGFPKKPKGFPPLPR